MPDKHTPGPWMCGTLRQNDGSMAVLTMAGDRIAKAWTGQGSSASANARLIAAAPDLLAACKAALGAFEHNDCIDWGDLGRAIDKAEQQ